MKRISAALVAIVFLTAANGSFPVYSLGHTYTPDFGEPGCYDQDNVDYVHALGVLEAGQSFSDTLHFCADTGNVGFYFHLTGPRFAISFAGSDAPVPAPVNISTKHNWQEWVACVPSPGATVTFTITALRTGNAVLSYGSDYDSACL